MSASRFVDCQAVAAWPAKQPFYVMVSVEVATAVWEEDGKNALQAVADEIFRQLKDGLIVGSDVKVEKVETARKRDTQLPTGLQGPP